MRRMLTARATLCALVLATLTGCDADPAAVSAGGSPQFSSSGPTLVECPTKAEKFTEGSIGSPGGAVALGLHRLELPVQAVGASHSFRITEVASNYMELDLKANDQDNFGFDRPVTITIDYSRCTRSNIDKAPLTVWKIDPKTKALLRNMGGIDDKIARTITFTSDNLSGYSIAN